MADIEPIELEVDSGVSAIETESVVAAGGARWRPVLAALVLGLLALITWQLISGSTAHTDSADSADSADSNDTDGADTEAAETWPPVTVLDTPNIGDAEVAAALPDPSVDDGGPIRAEAAGIGGQVTDEEADESDQPAFPLFPDRPGLTLAVVNTSGAVVLIDADDGTQTVINNLESDGSSRYRPSPELWHVDDTLVMFGSGDVVGYPLDGGASVNFGSANDVVVTSDLVVLIDFPSSPDGAVSLRGFSPDGRTRFDAVEVPRPDVWLSKSGFVTAPNGTYVFTGEGFQRVSAHAVSASGKNHWLEVRCDAVLDCPQYLVDRETGSAEKVDFVDTTAWWGNKWLSPDGRWFSSMSFDGPQNERFMTNIETGEVIELGQVIDDGNDPPLGWDPTSRYAAMVSTGTLGRTLRIFDTETGTTRLITQHQLGLELQLGQVVVLAPGEV